MQRQRFVIHCAFGCQHFTLKEEGSDTEAKVFSSIMDALTFARVHRAPEPTRVAVLNPFGAVMMETVL